MKHRRISLFMFLMLAVMLSTALSKVAAQEGDPSEKPQADVLAADVAQTTSPPPNKSESEFNGNFISADRIDVGDVISGKIGNNKDQDFFLLDNFLSGSSLIDIDARVNGSQLDAVVCLYDHKKTEIACNDDSDGLDSLIYFGGGLGPGYIRVRDFNYPNEGGNDYYYTLSVSDPLLISASTNGSIEDMPFKQADILAWQKFNNGSEKWSMFFDASDMGIDGPQDVEAIGKIADPLSISLVLGWSQRLCIWDDDLGGCNKKQVKPQDIIGFRPGSFGPNTWGEFFWVKRGADHCLTTAGEKIDAVSDRSDLVSTRGRARLCTGAKFEDEDIFSQTLEEMFFDGSLVPVMGREDIVAASTWTHLGTGRYYLTILGSGRIHGHVINQKQIIEMVYDYDSDTLNWGGIAWDGRDHNFNYKIDAIE